MKQLRHLTTERRRSLLLAAAFGFLILATVSSQAASDTDVTILKAESVLIKSNTVTIIAEATVSVTLTSGDYEPNGKGGGRPGSQITVKADKATFTIERQHVNPKDLNGPQGPQVKATQEAFDKFWGWTVEAAKDLQEGKPVGRIGYYGPEIVIKDHLVQSISGPGHLYRKR